MDPHHVNPDNHYVHVSPLSTYLKVFGALLVLTVATVGVSVYAEHVDLNATVSIIIAMAVAQLSGRPSAAGLPPPATGRRPRPKRHRNTT